MERFCTGDEAAFEALVSRHGPAVQSFLVRMVRDETLAEDLLQTTLLSVVRARGRFVPGQKFQPWLYTIAPTAARDALRRGRLRPVLSETGEVGVRESSEPSVGDPGLRRRLEDALWALPEAQREAVILHKVQGFPFTEVAQALGITEAAARIRAHRGYERLRALLGDLDEEGRS